MLGDPFYHEHIRSIIVGFGNLFSNLKVVRKNKGSNGEPDQTVDVPIAYGPKEKWVVKIQQDPDLFNNVYTIVPRLAFEIMGYNYDPTRALNKNNQIICNNPDGTRRQTYVGSPWNLDITLYVLTKNTEDALQIIEQILPYFRPELNFRLKTLPELNVIQDVPLVLTNITVSDEYDGSFESRRLVTHTLNFTAKLNLFGPVSTVGTINKVIVDLTEQELTYTAESEGPGSPIIETWIQEF